MSSFRKPFKSLEEIKLAGEFIPKGKIIPQRILKSPRKISSLIVAGSNQWAIPTPNGYVVFVENHDAEFDSVIRVKRLVPNLTNLNGSPYSSGGTSWQGNLQLDYGEFLKRFNSVYLSKCMVGNSVHDDSKQLQINIDYSVK